LILTLWFVVIYDPHWLVAAYGGGSAVLRLSSVLFVLLMICLAVGVPTTPAWSRRWVWYPPVLLPIILSVFTMPFAINHGLVRESLQFELNEWALIVGTVALIGTARLAERLLVMFAVSFLWWGLWGMQYGRVFWHTVLQNYDGYGAYMVIGIGVTTFLLQSTSNRRLRWTMGVAAALSAVGIVASFARGAFLAALAVFVTVWLRTQRKLAALGLALAAVVVMYVAASAIHGPDAFMAEMQTAFSDGTDEGTNEDRWILWGAGWQVFLERPVFGVGKRNFGVFGAQYFRNGDLGGMYEYNPGMLYGRSPHNLYVEILAEQGIVGIAFLIWALVDFWKRNRDLQSPEAQVRWAQIGGRLRLGAAARGLEVSMVAFLVVANVYSMGRVQWYYTLLGLNLLLHSLAFRSGEPLVGARRERGRLSRLRGGVRSPGLAHGARAPARRWPVPTVPPPGGQRGALP